ncbi:hemerythrin domain-containing protein [Amycolatopsis sp. K13G38]|uniref:Hemerythrin domain-containing protein n=1 Tax=Amycolatopsis acididurans TaxID=2724524 RepID=A0ABX1IY48_9PSEU|nr:hemerythrin domain-containing protein [Amycolatopsis acididurans]NKQ52443.1 hemerythrin domain-containing protein [Amycolatopsis acididurans]
MAVTDPAEPMREILHHHAVLRRGLEQRVGALCATAERDAPYDETLTALRGYLATEIMPHAEAEERTLYAAAVTQARGSELVRGLTAEHRELAGLADRLGTGGGGETVAAVAESIATLFASHVAKENDLLLPALTDSGADLASLLAEMSRWTAGAGGNRE